MTDCRLPLQKGHPNKRNYEQCLKLSERFLHPGPAPLTKATLRKLQERVQRAPIALAAHPPCTRAGARQCQAAYGSPYTCQLSPLSCDPSVAKLLPCCGPSSLEEAGWKEGALEFPKDKAQAGPTAYRYDRSASSQVFTPHISVPVAGR